MKENTWIKFNYLGQTCIGVVLKDMISFMSESGIPGQILLSDFKHYVTNASKLHFIVDESLKFKKPTKDDEQLLRMCITSNTMYN